MKNEIGNFIPNGVRLEKHEYDTVVFLLERGCNIELIPPSFTKGQHTADLMMDGVPWEMKSPIGKSAKTLGYLLSRAIKQSTNIIIDLRRSRAQQETSIVKLRHEFLCRKSIRKLKIILKDNSVIDFSR